VYFASSPIRISATTCPGGAEGVGNRGDTTLKFPEVSVHDYCPTFSTKVCEYILRDILEIKLSFPYRIKIRPK